MHIHPIRDRISSAYLAVEGDTATLIDAASEAIIPTVLTTLADAKVHLGLIVLTHYHYDHVGAATALRQATGAPVAIHRLDADRLRRGGQLHVTPTGLRGKLLAPVVRRGERAAVSPDIELDDTEDLTEYGGLGTAHLTPGHTAGSLSVRLPDGTVVVGDALTSSLLPPHRAAPPMFADDASASRHSISAIADLTRPGAGQAAGQVLVAHGGPVSRTSLDRLAARARSGQLRY